MLDELVSSSIGIRDNAEVTAWHSRENLTDQRPNGFVISGKQRNAHIGSDCRERLRQEISIIDLQRQSENSWAAGGNLLANGVGRAKNYVPLVKQVVGKGVDSNGVVDLGKSEPSVNQ